MTVVDVAPRPRHAPIGGNALRADRPARSSGLRQLLIGLSAAVVTYGIGVLLGVSVGT